MKNHETFTITLRTEGRDDRPGIIRLRALLKLMLRGYGLRCIGLTEGNTDVQVNDTQEIEP